MESGSGSSSDASKQGSLNETAVSESTKTSKSAYIKLIAGLVLIVLAVVGGAGYLIWKSNQPETEIEEQDQQTSPVVKESMQAELVLSEGKTKVKTDGDWVEVKEGEKLGEGIKLQTEAGRAVIAINGSVIRLNQSSEIKLVKLDSDNILIEQAAGDSYHRVVGYSGVYEVTSGEVTATTLGTVFSFSSSEDEVSVVVFDNSLNVKTSSGGVKKVSAGEKCEVETDKLALNVSATTAEDLTSEFLVWSKEGEVSSGQVVPDSLASVSSPQTTVGSATAPIPTHVPAEDSASTEAPHPDETEPGHAGASIFFIDSELQIPPSPLVDGQGVHLNWSACSSPHLSSYKVIRTDKQPDSSHFYYTNPAYPAIGSVSSSALSYTDSGVSSGTYYYRVCSVETNNEVWCGNVVNVTVP
jgi:hypothetical protein